MNKQETNGAIVIQTGRGPSVKGTRLTVYSILDDLNGGDAAFVRGLYSHLTDEEWTGVLQYIEAHRAELEEDLAKILRRNEEQRRYWEARNKERLARPPAPPANEKIAAARAKLAAMKQDGEQRRNGA